MPSMPQGDKHAKGISLVLIFHWRDLVAHTHLACSYMCAFSSHVTFTRAPLCIVSLCVFVYVNSCSVDVRKRPRLHIRVLGFARRPLLVIALAFSLDSPLLVNLRFDRRPWPPNETAVLDQRSLVWFCGQIRGLAADLKPPFHTWCIYHLGLCSAVMIRGLAAELIRGLAAEWNRGIERVQGQFCLFTCPVFDAYKYHTFSYL